MKRGNTALTTRQTFITNLATTQHCVHHITVSNIYHFWIFVPSREELQFWHLVLENQGGKSSLKATEEKCRDLMTALCSLLLRAGAGGRWRPVTSQRPRWAPGDQSEASMGTQTRLSKHRRVHIRERNLETFSSHHIILEYLARSN